MRPENVLKMSWRRFQNILKTFWRCLEDVLKTSWRRLEGVWPRRICWSWWRRLQDVFWRRMSKANIFVLIKTSWRRLHQDECLLGLFSLIGWVLSVKDNQGMDMRLVKVSSGWIVLILQKFCCKHVYIFLTSFSKQGNKLYFQSTMKVILTMEKYEKWLFLYFTLERQRKLWRRRLSLPLTCQWVNVSIVRFIFVPSLLNKSKG